jgi:hypothetical protein
MNMKFLFVAAAFVFGLSACNTNISPKAGRDLGGNPAKQEDPAKKPDPADTAIPVVGKDLEKTAALQTQKPTSLEAEFMNIMTLEFKGEERAFFTFAYAPADEGSLYFSLDQARMHMNGCTKPEDRTADFAIYWYEVKGGKRVLVSVFEPNITEFYFMPKRKFLLSYVLTDLKQFADCKSVTLKFASFRKDYK